MLEHKEVINFSLPEVIFAFTVANANRIGAGCCNIQFMPVLYADMILEAYSHIWKMVGRRTKKKLPERLFSS